MWEKIATSVIGAMILVWFKKWFDGATWSAFAASVWAGVTSMSWLSAFTGIGLYLRLAALAGAFGSGVYVTHWYYSVADLQRVNAQYAKDAKRMKTILGVNDKIDTGDADVEKSNQEILDGLASAKAKADKAPSIVVKTVEVPASCPAANAKPVCLTAAGLRKLGKLR